MPRVCSLLACGLVAVTSCGDNYLGVDASPDAPPIAEARLAIDRTSSQFGSILIDDASPLATFTISNTGTAASGALTASIVGDPSFAIEGTDCTTLAPATSCQVHVRFTPMSVGATTADLTVAATPGGTVTALLEGTGITPGALAIAASTNQLGGVVVGQTGPAVATFTVTNTGGTPTGPLVVQPAGSDPGDFGRGADTCAGQVLAAAATCTFEVAFAPRSAGAKSALFEVSASPGGRVQGAVNGLGLRPADLDASAIARNLGSVVVGQTGPAVEITITNTGEVATGTLAATLAGADAASFSIAGCDGTLLAPAASCTVAVRLAPSSTGAKVARLEVEGAPGGHATTLLTGTGIAADQLAIDPPTHGFPDAGVGQPGAVHTFTITNHGSAPSGALATVLAGSHASQFQLVEGADTCTGRSLAAGAQCAVGVQFLPTAGGVASAELVVSSGGSGAASAGVWGTGLTDAELVLAPAARGFGSLATGTSSATRVFTVTNHGGQASGLPAVSLSGTDAAQFELVAHDCTAALDPGAACAIQVRFTPMALGAAIASLDVTASPGGSRSATLEGDGIGAEQLVIVPSSLELAGTTIVGASAPAQTLTVHNLGTAATGPLAVTTSGPDAADFTVTSDCTTLAALGSCTVGVTFAPLASGTRTATVTVTGTPGGTASTALVGTARPPLEIVSVNGGPVVEPFDIGTAAVDTTWAHDVLVTVRNHTATERTLAITGAFGTPAQFVLVDSTCAATGMIGASGGTCTARVRFTPTSTGAHGGSLAFAIGSGPGEEVVQGLTGTGVEGLRITPLASPDFGSVPVHTTAAPRSFLVTNALGAPPTGPVALALTGAGLEIASHDCATLASGASCLVEVQFAPLAVGAVAGTLRAEASPGGASSLALTATGVEPVGAAPTSLSLSPATIAENEPAGTLVGVLSAVDPDPADTHTWALVAGAGSTDNAAFTLRGAEVRTVAAFDFEAQSSYAIRVKVTDSGGQQLEAPLTISVTDVDEPPVAVDDAVTLDEDSPATALDVLANDTDVDAGPKTITSVTPPAHGTVVVTGGGSGVTYQPAADYAGPDAFTYTLNGGSTATVAITVTAIDDAPVAVADALTVDEDSPATVIDVLANDTDVDGGPMAVAAVTQPAHGTVAITGGGAGVTYTPAADHAGADAFTYTLNGGSTATVSVSVIADDDAPQAVDDAFTVAEDSTANLLDVLANDTDIDGGPLTITGVTQPGHGTVTIVGGGTGVGYTPSAGYAGTDTFTYALNGGSTATVTLTVSADDDAPVAVDDVITVDEDSAPTTIDVLANDTDEDGGPMRVESVTQPAHGTVAITAGGAGVTYTPVANHAGADAFTYTLNGGSTATVSITVTAIDDAPQAVDDSVTVTEDSGATELAVLANDTDVDDGPMIVESVTQPAGGTVVISGGGARVSYVPAADHCTTSGGAPDVFTYTLSPGGSTATVAVAITCVDDAPVAVADAAVVAEDAPTTAIDVLANDTDVDDGPRSISAVTQPAAGTVVITGGGTGVAYAPPADFCTTEGGTPDTFTYTLSPGGSTTTVAVTVTCVDDAPTAVADAAAMLEDGGTITIDVLANDTDVDGGPKLVTSVGGATGGTTAVAAGGSRVTYTPAPNFCGADAFTYAITGGSSTTVAVTVTCVNDAPRFVAGGSLVDLPNQDVAGMPIVYAFDPWATGLAPGPANESGQAVAITVAGNTAPGLFVAGPTVTPTGALTFTTSPALAGTATITLVAIDSGGTANGGTDTSAPQMITISTRFPPPVAVDDAYTATGNVAIDVNVAAEGVLQRGTDDALYGAVLDRFGATSTPTTVVDGTTTVTTSNGGTVLLRPDGTFTYDPPPGFLGTDRFYYRLHNGGTDAVGTVSITVSDMIWFFDASTPSPGTGRRSSPFRDVTSFVNDGGSGRGRDGQSLFLAPGVYATNHLVLRDQQRLVGAGASQSLAAIAGITLAPFSVALPATGGTRPVLTSATTAVTVARNNAIHGVNVGASAIALAGDGIGTLVVRDVAIDTTGQALDLRTGSIAGAFDAITSRGGAANVALANLDSPGPTLLGLGGGALSGATGDAFRVTGGNLRVSYAGTIDNGGTAAVRITGKTGGTVALSGDINQRGGSRPLVIQNNTNGNFLVTGRVRVSSGADVGVLVSSNPGSNVELANGFLEVTSSTGTGVRIAHTDTVTIGGPGNTIQTTSGIALEVENVTLFGGLTFQSISASGGPHGIVLEDIDGLGLTVTGTGAAHTGGTIQSTSSHGILLTNVRDVALDLVRIQNTGGSGISGVEVTNFAFTNGTITGSGSSIGHANIAFNGHGSLTGRNLTGTLTVSNSALSTAYDSGIEVVNTDGTITMAMINGNTLTSSRDRSLSKGSGIKILGLGTASTSANLTSARIIGNTVLNFPGGAGVQVSFGNASPGGPGGRAGTPDSDTERVTISSNTIRGDSATRLGTHAISCTIAGGNPSSRSQGNFDVSGNGSLMSPIGNTSGIAVLVSSNGFASATASVTNNVIVANNTLGSSGVSGSTGPGGAGAASTPHLAMTVVGNRISQTDGNGLLLVSRDATGTGDFRVHDNTIAAPLAGVRPGIRVDSGTASSLGDRICLDIANNTTDGSGGHPGIGLRRQSSPASNVFGIEGMTATATPGVEQYVGIGGKNPGTAPGTVAVAGSVAGVLLLSATSGFSNCASAP